MELFSDAGSIPAISTKQVLDEHLLFQRRFRRKMCSLIHKTERRFSVKAETAFPVKNIYMIGLTMELVIRI